MAHVIYSDHLDIAGEYLPVHLASDRQVYVRLDELCDFIGLTPEGMVERIQQGVSTADLLVFMHLQGDEVQAQPKAAFLNLAALSFWLGTVSSSRLERPKLFEQLARYTFDFLDTGWMFYRAAARDLERTGITQTRLVPRSN